jgi:F-type H+-transporting ATPase subunit b
MNTFLFLAQVEEHAGSSNLAEQFGFSVAQLLAQVALFLIVLFVLKKYAFGPLLIMLEERKQRIAETLENSEKVKKELALAETTRKEILQKANDQAGQLIADAQKAASTQGEKRLQEAISQAEALIKKANEATSLEREKMMAELKKEVARLVVQTTGKVTGKVLTAEDQQRLNQEAVRQLAA